MSTRVKLPGGIEVELGDFTESCVWSELWIPLELLPRTKIEAHVLHDYRDLMTRADLVEKQIQLSRNRRNRRHRPDEQQARRALRALRNALRAQAAALEPLLDGLFRDWTEAEKARFRADPNWHPSHDDRTLVHVRFDEDDDA